MVKELELVMFLLDCCFNFVNEHSKYPVGEKMCKFGKGLISEKKKLRS